MEYIVLGTAGHIDHGKTSLVKALTGTNTDRLKEEKERGITIDLGFAYMPLPSGTILSIIDVPGHERFVRNMVAGAAGIDMVLLVIAADDGIMPQTREHLEICSLLGIRHGLVAVTKSDMVDDEWLSLTVEEIEKFLKGSFLEGAQVIPVSSVTGNGIDDLVFAIDSLAGKIKRRKTEGIFRMPVDRSFTIKGFGTVVTGTLVSGTVHVGDEVDIEPGAVKAKVRGIQIHGRQVEEAVAGSRVAVNLQGVERQVVKRGDTVSSSGILKTTTTVEAEISLLPTAPRPLKNEAELMLHIYSASTIATVIILDLKEIKPGDSGFARIRIREPLVAIHGDRFVLRSPDAGTIGGGVILDAAPPRRSRKEALEELKVLYSNDIKKKTLLFIKRGGINGTAVNDLSLKLNAATRVLEPVISELVTSGNALKIEDGLVSADVVKMLSDSAICELKECHKKEPMKEGILREELRTRLKAPQKVLGIVLERLAKDRLIVAERDALRLTSHKASGGETKERIEKIYIDAGLTPPTLTEFLEKIKIRDKEALDLLNMLSKEGKLVKVKDLFFSRGSIDGLTAKVREFFNKKSDMTPIDFKEMTGLSRKFAIPLLEYLDSQKVTIRVGDVRKLRKG
ncbi:MAG: selenocysteine-specific translation elongation factor [Deltaproteobacteria bacterium]|nr:selenocysteine-specific translation elongation factor [Deltaproteobacteria bacterium]